MIDEMNEKERLLKRDAEWAEVASEGRDVERILSYWTDDAVVIPPGMPSIEGKDSLRSYVENSMRIPGFKITWKSRDVTLSPDGRLGYMFSLNSITMNDQDGKPVTSEGRAITIWRKETNGEWRCAVDIWNSEATG